MKEPTIEDVRDLRKLRDAAVHLAEVREKQVVVLKKQVVVREKQVVVLKAMIKDLITLIEVLLEPFAESDQPNIVRARQVFARVKAGMKGVVT
jgi:hypothetical protein